MDMITTCLRFTAGLCASSLLIACASSPIAEPRSSSIYDTTGFGGTKEAASNHAVQNARMTCGDLPVTVVSDLVNQAQYKNSTATVFEVNLRYRCGNTPAGTS